MPKICFGHHLVPTCKFFPKSPIFSSIFLGLTKFFPKMQIFSTENLGPTYFFHKWKIFSTENLGPTLTHPYSYYKESKHRKCREVQTTVVSIIQWFIKIKSKTFLEYNEATSCNGMEIEGFVSQ